MDGKTERNAKIGRVYYKALTDAAGYPNGMAYWGEMSAAEKYSYTATGLQFLSSLIDMGLVTSPDEVGLRDRWGEGDCAELLKHFEATEADERKEFQDRVSTFQGFARKQADGENSGGEE